MEKKSDGIFVNTCPNHANKIKPCNKIINALYFIDSAPVGRADTFTTCLAI